MRCFAETVFHPSLNPPLNGFAVELKVSCATSDYNLWNLIINYC